MTKLLQRAFEQAQQLPDHEQDTLASIILAEIEDERRWDESFAASREALAELADEAMTEHRAGGRR